MGDESKLKIVSFADVPYEEPRFLIKPGFPLGKVTLIPGDPSSGKTSFMCMIAAKVSTGGNLLDMPVMQGNVLMLSVEDDASTLRGRIEASGGDVSKCYFVDKAYAVTFLHSGLQDAIKEADAKLVVFDPIQAFMGNDINMNQSNETRPILGYLSEVAKDYDCAIILIAHMAKARDGKNAVLRALGSVDIPGAARSVIQIGIDPSDLDRRVAVHVKSSNAAKGKSFTYTIGERGGVTLGGYSDLTAYDIDTASTRAARGVPYEQEPLVIIIRKLMSENPKIDCLSYSSLDSIAETLLNTVPYANGKAWDSAFRRLGREIYTRDKISIGRNVHKTESDYIINGEQVEHSKGAVRGVSIYKSGSIDLDKLLG